MQVIIISTHARARISVRGIMRGSRRVLRSLPTQNVRSSRIGTINPIRPPLHVSTPLRRQNPMDDFAQRMKSQFSSMSYNLRSSTGSFSSWNLRGIHGEPDRYIRYVVIASAILLIITSMATWNARAGMFSAFASGGGFNPLAMLTSPFFHTCPLVPRGPPSHPPCDSSASDLPSLTAAFISGAMSIIFFYMGGRAFLFRFGVERCMKVFAVGAVGGWLLAGLFSPDLSRFTYGRAASLPADFRACGLSAPLLAFLGYMAMRFPHESIMIFPLPQPIPIRYVAIGFAVMSGLGCLSNNPHRASSGYHLGGVAAGAVAAFTGVV